MYQQRAYLDFKHIARVYSTQTHKDNLCNGQIFLIVNTEHLTKRLGDLKLNRSKAAFLLRKAAEGFIEL